MMLKGEENVSKQRFLEVRFAKPLKDAAYKLNFVGAMDAPLNVKVVKREASGFRLDFGRPMNGRLMWEVV